MHWRNVIRFQPLLAAVVEASSKNGTARLLNHDKATVNRWLEGGEPNTADDVAVLVRCALERGIDISPFQTYEPIYDFSPHLTYEEKRESGPSDFGWLMSVSAPPPTSVSFCGLDLDSPIGIASSPLMADHRWASLMLDLQFGLSTFKTRRAQAKASWHSPQIAFVTEPPDLGRYDPSHPPEVMVSFSRPRLLGQNPVQNLVNSLGVPSENADEWCGMFERVKTLPRGRFVGVSVMGDGDTSDEVIAEYTAAISAVASLRPPFIELNPSCPNLEKRFGASLSDHPEHLLRICQAARAALGGSSTLLFLKLPFLSEVKLKNVVHSIGKTVDAISLRNTIRVRPVIRDRDGNAQPAFTGRSYAGLSGPCTFECTRRGIQSLVQLRKQNGLEFGIICIGGVSSISEIVELINLGPDLIVQSCTAAMFDPLLAWKCRFHLNRAQSEFRRYHQEEGLLLQTPRDHVEAESFKELHIALKEIRRRCPDEVISYEAVKDVWNTFMNEARVSTHQNGASGRRLGVARREARLRRQDVWLRQLMQIIRPTKR